MNNKKMMMDEIEYLHDTIRNLKRHYERLYSDFEYYKRTHEIEKQHYLNTIKDLKIQGLGKCLKQN